MKKFQVDLAHCQSYWEMHERFRQALDWPDFYGQNWDAFWDCLTGFMERPAFIRITGVDSAGQDVRDAMSMAQKILQEAKTEYGDIDYMIESKAGL